MAAPGALHDVLSAAARRLCGAGLAPADAAADVDVLARHVLGWDRARLLAYRREAAPPGFLAPFDALVERRLERVPVAYLTGTREFYGLDFTITPDVLIPRPETELLVDAALACLDARAAGDPLGRVVDVGTGSGCIAIAIAVSRPGVTALGIDRSRAALAVARGNARRHGVATRVPLAAADLLAAIAAGPAFDVVVSNPPYVPAGSPDVAVDVARHEPAAALYAGADGLDAIRRLVAGAGLVLRTGGRLLLEIGAGQADAVAALARGTDGWRVEPFRNDLQGLPRVAVLAWREPPATAR